MNVARIVRHHTSTYLARRSTSTGSLCAPRRLLPTGQAPQTRDSPARREQPLHWYSARCLGPLHAKAKRPRSSEGPAGAGASMEHPIADLCSGGTYSPNPRAARAEEERTRYRRPLH
eukprot:scaffold1190_cov393-Prasinococcus_capsulatus_cf.AAC.41